MDIRREGISGDDGVESRESAAGALLFKAGEMLASAVRIELPRLVMFDCLYDMANIEKTDSGETVRQKLAAVESLIGNLDDANLVGRFRAFNSINPAYLSPIAKGLRFILGSMMRFVEKS